MDTKKILTYGGLAFGAYMLLNKGMGAATVPAGSLPGGTVGPVNTAAAPSTTNVYGINQGQRGGNGSFDLTSNYAALVAYDPNLRNSNYQLTSAQIATYLNNYQDLRTGLQTWMGMTDPFGRKITNMNEAAQSHWMQYGSKEGRIYYPLVPVSGEAYIPAPVVAKPKSSGGGIFGTILKAVTVVAGGVLTVASAGTAAPLIAAGESAALSLENAAFRGTSNGIDSKAKSYVFTAGSIIAHMLPMYQDSDPVLTNEINKNLILVLRYSL